MPPFICCLKYHDIASFYNVSFSSVTNLLCPALDLGCKLNVEGPPQIICVDSHWTPTLNLNNMNVMLNRFYSYWIPTEVSYNLLLLTLDMVLNWSGLDNLRTKKIKTSSTLLIEKDYHVVFPRFSSVGHPKTVMVLQLKHSEEFYGEGNEDDYTPVEWCTYFDCFQG